MIGNGARLSTCVKVKTVYFGWSLFRQPSHQSWQESIKMKFLSFEKRQTRNSSYSRCSLRLQDVPFNQNRLRELLLQQLLSLN